MSASTSIPESNTDHAQPIVMQSKEELQESLGAVVQPPKFYRSGAVHEVFLTWVYKLEFPTFLKTHNQCLSRLSIPDT